MKDQKRPILPTRYVFAAALLVSSGAVLSQGCSASSPDPASPSKVQEARTPSADSMATQAPTGPTVSSLGGDLASEQKALDDAEKQLSFALQNKTALGEPLDAGTDRCTIVCRALTSMRESAKHVCGLAADRCGDANDRVKKAEDRAKGACPVCATPT